MTTLISTQDYVAMQNQDNWSVRDVPTPSPTLKTQLMDYLRNKKKVVALTLALILLIGIIILIVTLSMRSSSSSSLDMNLDDGPRQAYMSEGRGRLIKKLLENYDKRDHPHRNTVIMEMTLLHFDFHEGPGILSVTMWLGMHWQDPRLKWIPSDFGGEKGLAISPDEIWIPDITLYNRLGKVGDDCQKSNAVLEYNGTVHWIPACHFTPICKFNKNHTQQSCKLKFGSWVWDGDTLDIQPKHDQVEISSFNENPDWKLDNHTITRSSVKYDCCPEPYVDLTAVLTFSKRNQLNNTDVAPTT